MCFVYAYTENTTWEYNVYKLICSNNRWWPEKRFYRRWQQCFCLAFAIHRPRCPPLHSSAGVSLWTKLFQDYVKPGSFSDNKTETGIKSSRFKSHKGRVARKGRKVYDDRHAILFENQLNVFARFSQDFLLSFDYYLKDLCSIQIK